MLEQDFYRYHIQAARKDERLQLSELVFYVCILNLFDVLGKDYLHESARDYQREIPLSLGAIGNAIPRLVEYGYLRGSLYPNERGRDSWRLYLVDLRVGAKEQPPPKEPLATWTNVVEDKRITVTVEQVESDSSWGSHTKRGNV